MNLLLDTHAVIWYITEDEQLPVNAKEMIEDNANTCFVSIASLWEMGIKYSLGKLDLKADLIKICSLINQSGFVIQPITTSHILVNTNIRLLSQRPI